MGAGLPPLPARFKSQLSLSLKKQVSFAGLLNPNNASVSESWREQWPPTSMIEQKVADNNNKAFESN